MNNHIPVTESHQFSVSAPPLTLPLTVPFLVHWDNYLVKPSYNFYRGLPGGASGKGPACQCKLDIRDTCSIPGCGRSLGAGHSNLLQYSCLENPTDRRAWQAEVLSVTQSQTQLKQLSTAQLFIFFLIVYYCYMFEAEKCQSMNYVILTLTPEQTFNIPSDLSSILLKQRDILIYLTIKDIKNILDHKMFQKNTGICPYSSLYYRIGCSWLEFLRPSFLSVMS